MLGSHSTTSAHCRILLKLGGFAKSLESKLSSLIICPALQYAAPLSWSTPGAHAGKNRLACWPESHTLATSLRSAADARELSVGIQPRPACLNEGVLCIAGTPLYMVIHPRLLGRLSPRVIPFRRRRTKPALTPTAGDKRQQSPT